MSIAQVEHTAPTDPPTRVEETEQPDFLLPSLFASAAAIILALQDPINFNFQARPTETLVLVALGVAVLAFGLVRRQLPLFFVGTAVLFASITFGVITQPVQFNVPIVAVWPLRLALVLLVVCAWAFLMSPRPWLRRALIAFVVPTGLILTVWGGPATAIQLFPDMAVPIFGQATNPPFVNFAPYWLALDSHGNLYSTDSDGNIIWVFDSSGNPKGTLQPGKAPPIPTPGPGIIPAGYENELNLPGTGIFSTPTPIGGTGALVPRFEFCGIAVDPKDNLYTLDLIAKGGLSIMRFDRDGNITARWPVPKGYEPTSGCIAADAEHLYLSARTGSIYVLDYNARPQREIKLPFQPFGISPGGKGDLVVIGPNILKRVEADSGKVIDLKLPPSPPELQIPMLYTQQGELLVADHVNTKIVRVNPETGKIVGAIGGAGQWPGQVGAIGGLAEDREGRIYVADYGHRVIQRFTLDGQIDAIWWAARLSNEAGESER